MGGGKGGGSSTVVQTPSLTEEQKEMIKAQTQFFTGTIEPTYRQAVQGATELYNLNAPGTLAAAQNQARTALQAQEALGGTGESALRTGVLGLKGLFNPDYEANQVMAAIAPAQAQYEQNAARQAAQYGAIGNLGSARSALAERALAGSTASSQMQTAAAIQQGIANQRQAAANQLAGIGQAGIGQALGAAGNAVSASMIPQQLYNQYASVIFGTPSASYVPDFRGTQGSTQTGNTSSWNSSLNLGGGLGGTIAGGLLTGLTKSDRRHKENINYLYSVHDIPVYEFNYIGETEKQRGTMAQDLLEDWRYSDCVHDVDGVLHVDYSRLPNLNKE